MPIVGVSIIRSGDILLSALQQVVPGLSVGKILIQRDEKTEDKRPIVSTSGTLPSFVHHRHSDVLIHDIL
jgi:uracil phosphoribosyltransferase